MAMIVRLSLIVLLFGCVSCIRPVTPTLVPFGGTVPASLPSVTVCQAVMAISDIVSFTFYVAATSGPGGDTTTAYIAPWNNGVGQPIGVVSVVLPLNSAGYSPVTAVLNLIDLNPFRTYVICLTLPSTSKYEALTEFSDEGAGGFVLASGSIWKSKSNKNAVFALDFNSVFPVDPNYNYATSNEPGGWACLVNTSFSCLQVNWQTLKVNTGYTGCIYSNEVLYGYDPSCPSVFAVYGSASACWDAQYQHAWSYSHCDLTGTPFYFNDTWTVGAGFLADGYANFSNKNQTVDIAGSGDCGFTYLQSAGNAENGGFFLQLAPLYQC